ncbi:MAG: hypothetical protein COA43_09425 [Robiginitomaculum sp.]|nr:MAG: hypothetical protein COA43_09425 [Robiginitomaculum sp.]
MALIELAPPNIEPIDLAYAKQFLRVDGDDENTLITSFITLARSQVENIIGRTLITRAYKYSGDLPNSTCLHLPRPPLLAVTSITLFDAAEQSAVIAPQQYTVNIRRDPGDVKLNTGSSWADFLTNPAQIEIQFSAGYGESADDIPLPIKQAILLLLAQHFEYRDHADHPSIPMMVDALLMPYRWVRL